MKNRYELQPEDMDIMKEVGQISVGNILMTLQKILGKDINLEFPNVEVLDKKSVDDYFADSQIKIGLHFHLSRDITGTLLYIFTKADANKLIDALNEKPMGTTTILNEVEVTTIKEIANILSGSYLAALSKLSGGTILHSLPHFIFDSGESIRDLVQGTMSEDEFRIIILKSNLLMKKANFQFKGDIMIILSDEQLKKVLDSLKKRL